MITVLARRLKKQEVVALRQALKAYQVRTTQPHLFGCWRDVDRRVPWGEIKDVVKARMEAYCEANPDADVEVDDFMPHWYEFDIGFSDVSGDRRAWAEILLCIYCTLAEWEPDVETLKHQAALTYGAHYARRYGRMPPALGYRMRGRLERWLLPRRRRKKRKRQTWWRKVRNL